MDRTFVYLGQLFLWDREKAAINLAKHHVSFEQACEIFFDPFVTLLDTGDEDEPRIAAVGITEDWTLLFVVHLRGKGTPFESSPPEKPQAMKGEPMKTPAERIRKRLAPDRTMTSISIRMPEDVIDDLKEVAPALGFSGYQPLIRAYIGQGLRRDLARLEKSQSEFEALANSLRHHGVDEKIISAAIRDAKRRGA